MQFPVKSAPTTLKYKDEYKLTIVFQGTEGKINKYKLMMVCTHYKQCSFNHALMMTKDLKIDRQKIDIRCVVT